MFTSLHAGIVVTAILLVSLLPAANPIASNDADSGFQSLFDGASLTGWEAGNPIYWSVEDGAITGRITKDRPCTTNQYLVWSGGELADFELKLECRLNGDGAINGGFQFRSRLLGDGDICGYQVDNNLRTDWLVRLYDEYGRHDLALRGQRTVFDTSGARSVSTIESAMRPATFRLEDWHEYHLTCVGAQITLRVKGQVVAEVIDHDPRRAESQGVLALQLHSGPPTVAQFRNIRLKVLKPARKNSRQEFTETQNRLFREALAFWPLDGAARGAHPPLRSVPQFYQVELNVRADGPRARPDSKVAVLTGAYFDGGTNLHAASDQFTVWLRARDPRERWDAALFSKRGGHDRVHFNLFSTDLPHTTGPDIGFEIRTSDGFALVSFPVTQIDATAWHDLVGRYDGETLAIFCDGRRMGSRPARGVPVRNAEPLLIGAETDAGKVVRHFHGEVESAAIWSRALTDDEVAALTR